ncbi:hypothetical protein EVB87_003 [Rhizobium phage RHph_N28_1]|nr:hypothetical protein EVB87_003 [Rhizobium phage RHph_N28_1]QIG74031.1 hypothetical protein EVC07_003 [Rhizobium phage RHph_N42]
MTLAQLEAIKAVLAKTHGNSAFTAQSILLLQVAENCVDAAIAATPREKGDVVDGSPEDVYADMVKYMELYHTDTEITKKTDLKKVLDDGERIDLIDEVGSTYSTALHIGEELNANYPDDEPMIVWQLCQAIATYDDVGEDDDDDTDEEYPTIDDVEEEMEGVLFERFEDYDDDDDEAATKIKADLSSFLSKEQIEKLVVDTREVIAHTDAEIAAIRLIAPRIIFASIIASKARGKKVVPIARLARNLHAAIHGEFNMDAEQEAAFAEWMQP